MKMDNSVSPPASSKFDSQHDTDCSSEFVPIPGAAGYQVSNPPHSTAVLASLEVFKMTSMREIRKKSIDMTGYLEHLLLNYPLDAPPEEKPFSIITPPSSDERGAQLSIRLQPGMLESVMKDLEDNGVVVDERTPDVIRVAPAPFTIHMPRCGNSYKFSGACRKAAQGKELNGVGSLALDGGKDEKG
jgi:kynureninase